MVLTHKCCQCKESFRNEEMIQYASPRAKNLRWYCKKCYQDKLSREAFSDAVCMIFGIKAPGPRIWTERKRLIDTYGYTDQIIIDCLNYLYKVKKLKKLSESLCLINPRSVNEMLEDKKKKTYEATLLARAIQTEQNEYIVPTQKKKEIEKIEYDPDEWLDD